MAAIETPCSTHDPELWWPLSYTTSILPQVDLAIGLCQRCPIQVDCLAGAIERDEQEGIWGGYTPNQRREMRNAHGRLDRQLATTAA